MLWPSFWVPTYNTGCPVQLLMISYCIGLTYLKTLFLYLKLKFNWASYIYIFANSGGLIQMTIVTVLGRSFSEYCSHIILFKLLLNTWSSESESRSVVSNSLWPHGLCSWNSPGQNTEVGSLSLLQWIFLTQEGTIFDRNQSHLTSQKSCIKFT